MCLALTMESPAPRRSDSELRNGHSGEVDIGPRDPARANQNIIVPVGKTKGGPTGQPAKGTVMPVTVSCTALPA